MDHCLLTMSSMLHSHFFRAPFQGFALIRRSPSTQTSIFWCIVLLMIAPFLPIVLKGLLIDKTFYSSWLVRLLELDTLPPDFLWWFTVMVVLLFPQLMFQCNQSRWLYEVYLGNLRDSPVWRRTTGKRVCCKEKLLTIWLLFNFK